MKKPTKKQISVGATVALWFGLILTGIVATLSYQHGVQSLKDDGVEQYKATQCVSREYEDKSATWLECEEVRKDVK